MWYIRKLKSALRFYETSNWNKNVCGSDIFGIEFGKNRLKYLDFVILHFLKISDPGQIWLIKLKFGVRIG